MMRTFSAAGSRLAISTGLSASTQTSADSRALAHRDGARVGLVGDAAEAAGHDAPAVRRRGGVDAQHEGARREAAVLPARRGRQPHHLLADEIDAALADRLRAAARARRRRVRRRSTLRSSPKPGTRSAKAPAIATVGRARRALRSRSAGWPHHQVAMFGIFRSSPSRRRARLGRKPSSARDSSTPEPGMLATATPPARIASIRPGTPMREAALSSSGSHESASTRRNSTSARFRPATVRTIDAAVAHDEIVALDQQEAEIAREVGLFEIGLAEGAGRQQADARLAALARWRAGPREARERTAPGARRSSRCRGWERRATGPAGFPAHSRRPTAPACGRRAPTSARPARGRYRRRRD